MFFVDDQSKCSLSLLDLTWVVLHLKTPWLRVQGLVKAKIPKNKIEVFCLWGINYRSSLFERTFSILITRQELLIYLHCYIYIPSDTRTPVANKEHTPL